VFKNNRDSTFFHGCPYGKKLDRILSWEGNPPKKE
jgi:hypothetical protein